MIIEELNSKDLELYKVLIDECFGSSNDIKEYNKYSKNDNYKIFVVKKDNKIIGSVTIYKIDLFTFSFQPTLELFNFAVLKNYRREKVANNLFEYVCKYAKNNGYNNINLTCLDTAFDAHKFYEKMGMKKMSSIKYNINLK